ncbi:protein DpdH [Pseudomonas sp. NFACC42-2]|uniref:protein DpdH n=1 Tax=Pseudomonas sp. NFACC42-2 TaxID=1566193 RepID=UPI0008E5FFC0|nr:protein DpdH [Pseudomonas sp. NFACC42-2]SFS26655.1 AAA ATPase domain-containing protein [Pseudomonas sp. NFACC42-2]
MSMLQQYWPISDHAAECLRTEAETVDEALLLAVHEPTTLLRRSAQSGLEVSADEIALLDELMRPVTDGSAVVVAITGASGVGKSHMVRWLRAQLERHPRRKELVVVSIPKTASLRRVVELILEPLANEQYEALKRELQRASEALTPSTAAELLAAAMGEGLKEYRERTVELVQNSPSENGDLKPFVAVAEHARSLILSPEARDLWLSKVLLRIVGASFGGTSNPVDRQFRDVDLEPPEDAPGQDLPHRVQSALAFLGNANGRYRSTAAEILQEVLDNALRTVFRVTEALQQKSIQDVVDDIRRQLLTDGKELVLLIEDLAALSGIQQPLLDIMIAESDEHGRRVRAPIRTAVAVTDGFLAGRQTVLTRAKEQWVVPSEGLSEELIVGKLVELTGRYLNAARWGVRYLKREFSKASLAGTDLYAWVPTFDEPLDTDAAERLDAFGRSGRGYSLFPFNVNAIRGLAEVAMKLGGVWNYNPRAFINEVLRKTLAERLSFVEGQFPPAGFKSPRLIAEVRTELQRKGYSQVQSQRLEVVLHYWGGRPTSLTARAPISKVVFETFSLPWPFGTAGAPERQPTVSTTPSNLTVGTQQSATPAASSPPTPKIESTLPVPDISAYADALEAWTPNNRLPNTYARETRNLIASALDIRLDLGNFCLKGQKIEASWFWLPPTTTVGNPNNGLIIQVVGQDQPIPASVQTGLKALARWEKNAKSWCYEGAEADYAAANVLLEQLESQVLRLLSTEAECDTGMLARALHTQSLLLGLSSRGQPDAPNFKELFAASPDESIYRDSRVDSSVARCLEVRSKATAARSELQDRLKQLIGCFQGDRGGTVMAIDSDRLRQAWRAELPQRWVLGLKGRDRLSEDASDVLERISTAGLPALASTLQSTMQSLLPLTSAAFEADHARIAWREEMRQLVKEALDLAAWPSGIKESEVHGIIGRLSLDGIESVIQRIHKMSIPSTDEAAPLRLAALCAVPLPRLSQLACDVSELNRFFNSLNSSIQSQTRSVESEHALAQRHELIKRLEWES